jgi:hypothetical protein
MISTVDPVYVTGSVFYHTQVEEEKRNILQSEADIEIAILIKYLNYEFGKFL